jgi:hypothetical protein
MMKNVQHRSVVNTEMDLWVPYEEKYFLTKRTLSSQGLCCMEIMHKMKV